MKRLTMKVKSLLIGCLLVVMALCVVATASLGGSAFATGAEKPIKMQGASIKLTTATSSEYGLRFETHIEKQTYDNIVRGADFKIGMLYYPTDMLSGELTVETSGVGKWDMTDKYEVQTIGGVEYCVFKGYIRNMPAEEYDRQITARSYILNNGNYTYADAISRSSLEVARYDYNDNAEDRYTIETLYFTPYENNAFKHDTCSVSLNDDNTLQLGVNFSSTTRFSFAKSTNYYKPGTYIMTEFVGEKMVPSVFFGVTDVVADEGTVGTATLTGESVYTSFGFTGLGVLAGVHNPHLKYVYRTSTEGTPTVDTGVKRFYNYGYLKSANTGNFGEAATQAPQKTYVLVIGADNVTSGINVEHMLFEKDANTGVLTAVEKVDQLVSGATLNAGSILFASATKVQVYSDFKLYNPDTRANILAKLDEVYNYEYSEPTISASDFVVSASNTTVTIGDNLTYNNTADDYYNVKIPFAGASLHNYAYTENTYAPGTYVLTEFLGANFPEKILFGSDRVSTGAIASQDNTLFAASGVGFDGDEGGQCYTWSKETASNTVNASRIFISGGNFRRGYFLDAANAEKTFVLIAGADNVSGSAVVEYILLEKNTDTGELKSIQKIRQPISGVSVGTGRIVFSSSIKTSTVVSNFKLYTPDTKENILAKLDEIYNFEYLESTISTSDFVLSTTSATVMTSDNVTYNSTADDYYNISIPHTTVYNYAKTVTTYESGTYLLMEFTGKGAPMNIFFGVTNADNTSNNADDPLIEGVGLRGDRNSGTSAIIKKSDGTVVSSSSSTSTERGMFDRRYLFGTDGSGSEDYFAESEDTETWRARNYVMLVGAEQDGANVKIEYSLYLNENGTLSLLQNKGFTFNGQTLNVGSIAFTHSIKRGYTTSLKFYQPDTKANLTALMETLYTMPSAE